MKLICTKCRSDEVYIKVEEQPKLETEITLDDWQKGYGTSVPAIYKTTTWACKKCGYSVTR